MVLAAWQTLLRKERSGRGMVQQRHDASLGLCAGKRRCTAGRAPADSRIGISGGCSQNGHAATAWHSPASSFVTNSEMLGRGAGCRNAEMAGNYDVSSTER